MGKPRSISPKAGLRGEYQQRGLTRRACLAACAGAGFGFVPLANSMAAERIGRVARVVGEASAELEGASRRLLPDSNVLVGDLLLTGKSSRLGVELGPRTNVSLGENCKLRIDKYLAGVEGDFTLEAGVMKFDAQVPAGQKRPDLKFKSIYGLLSVRGTTFYAGPNRGNFALLVMAGTVAISAGGVEVMVGAGEGIDIARPGERPPPVRRWGQPRIQEMLAAVQ